jgi:beta-lactamase regulating signal transducer with metallopeptidase domain
MISWLIDTLLGVTLLMLLILAVRRPVARFFGAGWAYALWLLPPLRLVLPPLPQLSPEFALPPAAAFIPALGGVTAPLPVEAGPGQWVPFLLATWAGGAVTFLIWHWLSYRAFLKALTARARPGDPPSWGGIETLSSEAAEGPLAIGLLRRLIVLPWHFSRRYNEGERRLAMEHELVHHRRGDIWWNMAALVVLAANWFNPIAWFAFHAFRGDQELACDAAVAKRASRDERLDYARALVKSASRPGLIAACPLNRAEELKRRLRMIRSHREGKARMAGGLAAFAALLAGGLAISNPARPVADIEIARLAESMAPQALVRPQPAPAASAPAAVAARPAARTAPPARVRVVRPEALAAAKVTARAKQSFAGLAVDNLAPRPAAPAFLYAAHAGQSPAIRLAQVQFAPAAAAVPAPSGARAPRSARTRRVVVRIEGNRVLRIAGGANPAGLTVVQAALERAIAESNDEETRQRLGRAVVVVEAKLEELGMITTIN